MSMPFLLMTLLREWFSNFYTLSFIIFVIVTYIDMKLRWAEKDRLSMKLCRVRSDQMMG
jgi:hypothetical protein